MSEETVEQRQARWRSVGYLAGGRTGPKVKEFRDERDGHRIKATTDELNNVVTEHNTKDDRQDVLIRAPETVRVAREEIQ